MSKKEQLQKLKNELNSINTQLKRVEQFIELAYSQEEKEENDNEKKYLLEKLIEVNQKLKEL